MYECKVTESTAVHTSLDSFRLTSKESGDGRKMSRGRKGRKGGREGVRKG